MSADAVDVAIVHAEQVTRKGHTNRAAREKRHDAEQREPTIGRPPPALSARNQSRACRLTGVVSRRMGRAYAALTQLFGEWGPALGAEPLFEGRRPFEIWSPRSPPGLSLRFARNCRLGRPRDR